MTIPIVLPVVQVVVDGAGALTIEVDGELYDAGRTLCRGDLRSVLDEITGESQSAVRVEVLESDGTTYADIATPPVEHPDEAPRATPVPTQSMPGISGHGFRPREQIAVAVVLLHQTADDTGSAVVNLPPAVMSACHASVVLFGLDSKMTALVEAPA